MDRIGTVYLASVFDLLHRGHMKYLNTSSLYGTLIIGLVDDESAERYKGEKPIMNFDERKKMLEEMGYFVERYTAHYDERVGDGFRKAIRRWKPDVVTHGDDWGNGKLIGEKKVILEELAKYGGKLIEIPYTKGVSDTKIKERIWARKR